MNGPKIDLALLLELQEVLQAARQTAPMAVYQRIVQASGRLDMVLEPMLAQEVEVQS